MRARQKNNSSLLRPDAMPRNRRRRCLPVEWRDCAWRPRVVVRLEMKAESQWRNEEMVLPGAPARGASLLPFFCLPCSRRATFSNL